MCACAIECKSALQARVRFCAYTVLDKDLYSILGVSVSCGSVSVCVRVGVCALVCELSFVAVCITRILLSLSVLVLSPWFQYHLANSGLGTTFCLEIGEIKQIKHKTKYILH